MAFSSVHEMIDLCKESGKPLYEVILESDLAESGLTRAESEAEMHRLWAVMQATSDGYCGADRSMSGFAGGDAAKVNAAAACGVLYADGYFADVMAEALKTAECNACMKRIVAAPTAGSCGVLPAVLLPLQRRGLADEAAVHRALYIAAGFGQVVAARATLAGAEGGCQAEVGAASGMAAAKMAQSAKAVSLRMIFFIVYPPFIGEPGACAHESLCMFLILRREAPTVNLAGRFGMDSQRLPAYKTNEKQG